MPNTLQLNPFIETIQSEQGPVRDRSLESLCEDQSLDAMMQHIEILDQFRRGESNLYRRVRALFFLASIYRYQLPPRLDSTIAGSIPFDGYEHLLGRRFQEAIDCFLDAQSQTGPTDSLASALAHAYHEIGFQTLADQVRHSVRTVRGNQWMFRLGHVAEHPLRIRKELLTGSTEASATMPVLRETTAVRMDVSHSAWSDIFFLGMDFPQGARVINVSVDLGVRGRDQQIQPPIETYLRVIDRPVFRLVSVDLGASTEVTTVAEMFDFARDYLGLLKAAVIASGVVPPGLEGCGSSMAELLEQIVGRGRGLELVSKINDIPKGSRLAVSTNLLGSLISNLMRATGQIRSLEGPLTEPDRRLVAARAILGEWIGGSGGGWQDSGGVWPGIKLICGQESSEGDPEYQVSRGRLMPDHTILGEEQVSQINRDKLQDSLVLVHGGMAQNVGPILEMVTEHYLVRGGEQWTARGEAMTIYDEVVEALCDGDIRRLGSLTTRNFEGPLQTIIPWATNRFTDRMIQACRDKFDEQFWGFWMLGGMSGGGMGFIFDPAIKAAAQDWLAQKLVEVKRELETALPFAMDPVVYDFSINDNGTSASLLSGHDARLPQKYYALMLPQWLRQPLRDLSPLTRDELSRISSACGDPNDNQTDAAVLLQSVLPSLPSKSSESESRESPASSLSGILRDNGFDRNQHEQVRDNMRSGRFGLASNRLAKDLKITDVSEAHVTDTRGGIESKYEEIGRRAIAEGEVGVVTLAAGVGSRWTQGAGVCKALHPFHRFAGRHRNFLEIHLAKNRAVSRETGGVIPHVVTTSWMTDEAIRASLERNGNFGFENPLHVSSGRSVGLRMVPMVRDLQFLWEETPQQVLDQQQQKMRESGRLAIANWARTVGEGSDYTDNVPSQCVHPVGHWYEVPNLFRNGTLSTMLRDQPSLKYLMLHNIDTLGANVDPSMFGLHIDSGATLSYEVIPRRLEDRGGGLALVSGRPRLVEGLAMPDERAEFGLRFYNSMTTWIEIDGLLNSFGLNRQTLNDPVMVDSAVREMAARLPTYITIKEVKKRWGHAQEDVFPVAQFEKLWGDMTTLPDVDSRFIVAPMRRGQQLKEPSQLDGWNRDGGSAYIDGLCDWNE